jgi:hypothetical protein
MQPVFGSRTLERERRSSIGQFRGHRRDGIEGLSLSKSPSYDHSPFRTQYGQWTSKNVGVLGPLDGSIDRKALVSVKLSTGVAKATTSGCAPV